jgi:predicted RND superfamily exporter protein
MSDPVTSSPAGAAGRPTSDETDRAVAAGTRQALEQAASKYNKSLLIAAVGGLVSLVVLAIFGYADAGVLLCVGLGLGVINSMLVQRSLATSIERGEPDRKGLTLGMLKRLVIVSAVAFAIAILYPPHGWFVFLGLATFQMLVMTMVFGSLVREVRRG